MIYVTHTFHALRYIKHSNVINYPKFEITALLFYFVALYVGEP